MRFRIFFFFMATWAKKNKQKLEQPTRWRENVRIGELVEVGCVVDAFDLYGDGSGPLSEEPVSEGSDKS